MSRGGQLHCHSIFLGRRRRRHYANHHHVSLLLILLLLSNILILSNAFVLHHPPTQKTMIRQHFSLFQDYKSSTSTTRIFLASNNNDWDEFRVRPGDTVDMQRMEVVGSDYSNEFPMDTVVSCEQPGANFDGQLTQRAQVIVSLGPEPGGGGGAPEESDFELAADEYIVKRGTKIDKYRMYVLDFEPSPREGGTVLRTLTPGRLGPDGSTMHLAEVIVSSGPNGDWKDDSRKGSNAYGQEEDGRNSRGFSGFSSGSLGPVGGPGKQEGYIYGPTKKKAPPPPPMEELEGRPPDRRMDYPPRGVVDDPYTDRPPPDDRRYDDYPPDNRRAHDDDYDRRRASLEREPYEYPGQRRPIMNDTTPMWREPPPYNDLPYNDNGPPPRYDDPYNDDGYPRTEMDRRPRNNDGDARYNDSSYPRTEVDRRPNDSNSRFGDAYSHDTAPPSREPGYGRQPTRYNGPYDDEPPLSSRYSERRDVAERYRQEGPQRNGSSYGRRRDVEEERYGGPSSSNRQQPQPPDNNNQLGENEYSVNQGTQMDKTRMYVVDFERSERHEGGTVLRTLTPGLLGPDGSTINIAEVIVSSGPNGDWRPENPNRMQDYDDESGRSSRGMVGFTSKGTLGPPGGPGKQDGYTYGPSSYSSPSSSSDTSMGGSQPSYSQPPQSSFGGSSSSMMGGMSGGDQQQGPYSQQNYYDNDYPPESSNYNNNRRDDYNDQYPQQQQNPYDNHHYPPESSNMNDSRYNHPQQQNLENKIRSDYYDRLGLGFESPGKNKNGGKKGPGFGNELRYPNQDDEPQDDSGWRPQDPY